MSFRILGTGSALPERVVTTDDLSDFLVTSDEWIFTRTGIKERRICTEETLDDLAMEASRRALDMAGENVADPAVALQGRVERVDRGSGNAEADRDPFSCPTTDVCAACGMGPVRHGRRAVARSVPAASRSQSLSACRESGRTPP